MGTFLQSFKRDRSAHAQRVSMTLTSWKTALTSMAFEGRHCIPIFNVDILYICIMHSLRVKADIQGMKTDHKTGCSSYHKVHVKSCISQNDFPIPEYMKVSSTIPRYITLNIYPTDHKITGFTLNRCLLLDSRKKGSQILKTRNQKQVFSPSPSLQR